MEQNLIEKLRIAANQFYVNKYMDQPLMSDKEFDQLAAQYESETKSSVKELIEWEPGAEIENIYEEPLEKTKHEGDLMKAVMDYIVDHPISGVGHVYLNLKYDGGGIKLIYNELGMLKRVVSQPDEEFGLDRTAQFWNLVPHRIDPNLGIQSIRGEVLCDPDVYGQLARNKANGLVNSTVSFEEVSREAFIRVYKITFFDGKWTAARNIKVLNQLPVEVISRTRLNSKGEMQLRCDVIFRPATEIEIGAINMKDPIVDLGNGEKWQADGLVLYSDTLIHGFKFYYTDSVITEVEYVDWNRKPNGSITSRLKIKPISLNDKDYNYVNTNGVSNMVSCHMGKGAKVRIGLSGLTIPQILEVVEPSDDFQWPTCECGYQFTEDDIYGLVLKCGNKMACSGKVSKWTPEVQAWIEDPNEPAFKGCTTLEDCIRKVPEWFGYAFHIDRWDPLDKFKGYSKEWTVEMAADMLIDLIKSPDLDKACQWMTNMYYLTDLQMNTFEVNCGSGIQVLINLKDVIKLQNNES